MFGDVNGIPLPIAQKMQPIPGMGGFICYHIVSSWGIPLDNTLTPFKLLILHVHVF